ncbi:flavin-containing monooxygenase [Luteipulveratus mongoliensis]|uniref:FAD-dependent oxidoreductase n=1 Tax=Luteipulveratus mongoliensis TaxID=571913 RepID=A0A0K1JFY3_9MICO|nr:NAD(P)/FAD-dependent oxidoreductase [Luteipulveratus mongoliensis]AKU15505.1 FAD-dependent oxidoreductase [Luteipulveratus mongoliensis]
MSIQVDHDAVVVGSGFSGIAMAIALKAAGRDDFAILEKADEVGGTWRENRYPGCECDVPAHLYSYSFELNPYWSQSYAPADEIQDYLLYCVEKYDLRRHLEFDSTVQDAAYDDETGTWTLTIATSWGTLRTIRTRDVMLGVGALHEPHIPEIPGLETFAGELMHTATWDRGTTVSRKRVGVIGTGSSGVQIIPPLAEDAAHLTVFQRSAPWVMPRSNTLYADRLIDTFEQHPAAMRAHRAKLKATSDLRERGITSAPKLLKAASRLALENLHASIKSPELRAKLTPDYAMGCKRVLLSSDYYPALASPNVTVETAAIDHVEPDAIVTAGERHQVDVLVLATGFDPLGSYRYLGIKGAEGHLLSSDWDAGATAYLGVTVPHFPNLFLLLGPNTLLGHTSDLQMIEAQVGLVMQLIRERDRRHLKTVGVRPQVVPEFLAELDRRSKQTVWASGGCDSWYLDEEGRNRTLWPGSVAEYEKRTTRPEMVDYHFA